MPILSILEAKYIFILQKDLYRTLFEMTKTGFIQIENLSNVFSKLLLLSSNNILKIFIL